MSAQVKQVRFVTPTGVSDLVAAAGLLLGALKVTGCSTLVELVGVWDDPDCSVVLDDAQRVLLFTHRVALLGVGVTAAGSVTTVAVCSTCGDYVYVSSSVVLGAGCRVTANCGGSKLVKAKAAARTK